MTRIFANYKEALATNALRRVKAVAERLPDGDPFYARLTDAEALAYIVDYAESVLEHLCREPEDVS